MYVGNKILELRKSKGYSQEDIANKLNVSRQTVSKWETNQSMPDFDKIVPLCDLFGITTDELLREGKEEKEKLQEMKYKTVEVSNDEVKYYNKRKFALGLSIAIFLYFVSVMWIIFSESLGIEDNLGVVGFLGIVGVATVIIIYTSIIYSKKKSEEDKSSEENPIVHTINGIMGLVFTAIYLYISFVTMAWHITWIIWVVYGIFNKVVELIFMLKEVKDE